MKNKNIITLLSALFITLGTASFLSLSSKKTLPSYAVAHQENYGEYVYDGNYYTNKSIHSGLGDGINNGLWNALDTKNFPSDWYRYSGDDGECLSKHLQNADEDPLNPNNMILFYTRDSIEKCYSNAANNWDREHVWCQSHTDGAWGTSEGGTDLLQLRPSYGHTNRSRSNKPYKDLNHVDPLYHNGMLFCYSVGNYYEPIDAVKGDVARILMYLFVTYKDYYQERGHDLDILDIIYSYDTLLEWHILDAPDLIEGHRNDYSESSIQQNRNPFVDHPEFAWHLFGDECSSSVKEKAMSRYPDGGYSGAPTNISIVNDDNVTLVKGEGLSLRLDFLPKASSHDVTYSSSNSSIASVDNNGIVRGLSSGNVTITVRSNLNNAIQDSINICVKTCHSIVVSGTPNVTSYTEGDKFKPEGLTVSAIFDDLSNVVVDLNECLWKDGVTGEDRLSVGTTSVTCLCFGHSFVVNGINVRRKTGTDFVITTSSFSTSGSSYDYRSYSVSDGDETLSGTVYGVINGTNMQFNNKTATNYSFYNTSAPDGEISAITLTCTFGKTSNSFSIKTNPTPFNSETNPKTSGTTIETIDRMESEEEIKIDVTTGDSYFAIVPNGAIYFSSITVTYELEQPQIFVTDLELNKTSLNLKIGQEATLIATVLPLDATNQELTWFSSNPGVASVSGGVINALSEGETIISVSTTDGSDLVDTCTINVIDSHLDSLESGWFMVDHISDLKENEKYLIVYNGDGENFAMSEYQKSSNRDQIAVSLDEFGVIENLPAPVGDPSYGAQVITLKRSSVINEEETINGWALSMVSGENTSYLYASSGGANQLKTRTSINLASLWDISFDASGNAVIVSKDTDMRGTMRYNSVSDLFSCYLANNSMKDIRLYRYYSAFDYAQNFLDVINCPNGQRGDFNITSWNKLSNDFLALPTLIQNCLIEIVADFSGSGTLLENFKGRYEYVLNKYSDEFYDFMSGVFEPSFKKQSFINNSNSIVIISSLVAVIPFMFAILFIFKNKKSR